MAHAAFARKRIGSLKSRSISVSWLGNDGLHFDRDPHRPVRHAAVISSTGSIPDVL